MAVATRWRMTHVTASRKTNVDVLVVGAGPTGLVLALWLAKAGVRFRAVDRAVEPGTTSRAVGVAARTLELYRQLGIADEVVAAGWPAPAVDIWVRGKRRARAELGAIGEGLSAFPFELMYPQDEHERLLIKHLAELGVEIDRPRTLVGFADEEDGVHAQLDDGTMCTATYLAGCDGAHSAVRNGLGIGFPGGSYEHEFFVADISGSGPALDGEVHISLDTSDFLAVFPLAGPGHARLIGTVRHEAETEPRWEDVSASALERLHMDVTEVRWFSTYHVHHRVASSFRAGRVFLLGDAAHIHSPVGAQGMNTGIGDAVNLAWKLAAVLRGEPAILLDTYEPERRTFAKQLVATTDRAFQIVNHDGGLARAYVRASRRSQSARSSALRSVDAYCFAGCRSSRSRITTGPNRSATHAGRVRTGDRLPWLPASNGDEDNFAPLAARAWQLHVYGEVAAELRDHVRVPLHAFAWSEAARVAGLAQGVPYLIRPDGYVGDILA